MVYFFYLYAHYHQTCIELREFEMRSDRSTEDTASRGSFSGNDPHSAGILEALLFPIGGFLYGAIPALQAILSHLFTERLVYIVSSKPSSI